MGEPVAEGGAFTADGPWVVDPQAMPWRQGIVELRARTQARVPHLIARRRVPPRRVATASARLTAAVIPWVARYRGRADRPGAREELAARIRPAFERLGTTYLKLGQLIASAEGMLPAEFVEEFKLCRDRVPPETFDHVREVVEADLGAPIDALFAEFDPVPLAAASIAQVHVARLTTGEEVVVKVQRPGIAEVVAGDLGALAWLAPILERWAPAVRLANLPAYVELFTETIVEELDFRLEAENMLDIAAVLATTEATPVVVPRPHPELVTERVLVMERMRGFAIDDDAAILDAGIDAHEVFRALLVSLVEGAMVHGVFHGDLHAGNMSVLPDGTAAIFDFGITGRLAEQQRQALMAFLMTAISQDLRAQLDHFQAMGGFPPDADMDRVAEELDLDSMTVAAQSQMTPEQMATVMQDSMKRLIAHGARLPKPLFLYLKGNVYLNGAITALAPDIDVFGELAAVMEYMATVHGDRFKDEIGLDLTDAAFSADSMAELMRAQLGVDAAGLSPAEINALQQQRMKELRAAGRPRRRSRS